MSNDVASVTERDIGVDVTQNQTPRKRRTAEEIAASRSEQEARRCAREQRLAKTRAHSAGMAASFERRAERIAAQPKAAPTASQRKTVRKLLRAAAEHDRHIERERARLEPDGGEVVDRGTGLTQIKLGTPPVGMLIAKKSIGAEERMAADEISLAFTTISMRVAVRGMTFERVDKSISGGGNIQTSTARAVQRYIQWSKHWAARESLYGDPTQSITIAAVIDERPIRTIAYDQGIAPARAERAIIAGLRDYAARAGMVDKRTGAAWMSDASMVFLAQDARLIDAIRRAKIEV